MRKRARCSGAFLIQRLDGSRPRLRRHSRSRSEQRDPVNEEMGRCNPRSLYAMRRLGANMTIRVQCQEAKMGISAKMPPSVVAILLCVILFTTSCAVEPKKMIVGTWRDRDGDAWEFFPDGTLSVSTKRGAVTGKYSFPDQDHIKL